MNRQLHSRKGVSIAEVVIALAIIAVISAFTLSLIVMSISVESKSVAAIEVKNAAENAIECFRFARDNQNEEISCFDETAQTYTLSQLFFLCLRETGNYISETPLGDGTVQTQPSSDGNIDVIGINGNSIFKLVVDGCTITIKQTATGFSFVAMRGEEELENFTFPREVETDD